MNGYARVSKRKRAASGYFRPTGPFYGFGISLVIEFPGSQSESFIYKYYLRSEVGIHSAALLPILTHLEQAK